MRLSAPVTWESTGPLPMKVRAYDVFCIESRKTMAFCRCYSAPPAVAYYCRYATPSSRCFTRCPYPSIRSLRGHGSTGSLSLSRSLEHALVVVGAWTKAAAGVLSETWSCSTCSTMPSLLRLAPRRHLRRREAGGARVVAAGVL
jgi:hypothetical protein